MAEKNVELIDKQGNTASMPPDRAERAIKGGGWRRKDTAAKPVTAKPAEKKAAQPDKAGEA